jgi:hypothetical protein
VCGKRVGVTAFFSVVLVLDLRFSVQLTLTLTLTLTLALALTLATESRLPRLGGAADLSMNPDAFQDAEGEQHQHQK